MAVPLRRAIKQADAGPLKIARDLYYALRRASLPMPTQVMRPLWQTVDGATKLQRGLRSKLWVAPLFRGLCEEVGAGFSTGIYLPYVSGRGRIHLGDQVTIYGQVDFYFASLLDAVPEVHVGDHTSFGHRVTFAVARSVRIGERCLVADEVSFQDSSGHPTDPARRRAGLPPEADLVKPIVVGDNVWLGRGARVLPGVRIGDDCVISAGVTVSRSVPAGHLVTAAASKAVRLRDLSRMTGPSQP